MAKGKGKTPTKKQLLSPKLDGMGFSNEEIMDGLIKHKLITDEDMKMMFRGGMKKTKSYARGGAARRR